MNYEEEATAIDRILADLQRELIAVAENEAVWIKKQRHPDLDRPEWQALADLKATTGALATAVISLGGRTRLILDELAAGKAHDEKDHGHNEA